MNNSLVERLGEQLPVIFGYFHSSKIFDLEETNITLPQLMALGMIQKKESPKMTDIAGELGVTLSNVTSMTDRLIESGYVERIDDPKDRRIVRVRLTAKGKTTLQKAFERKKRSLKQIFGRLSSEDQKTLLRITEKLVTAIKQERGK